MPATTPEEAIQQYLDNHETETTDYEKYVPRIDGTSVIPIEVEEGIQALIQNAVEKKTKQSKYTMFDKFGLPWTVVDSRLSMMLQEKLVKTGERLFFARPPKNAPPVVESASDQQIAKKTPVLLSVKCPICPNKTISENPHWQGPQPVLDRDDESWRKDILLFQHVYKRHKNQTPRYFRDKDRRDDLARYIA